MAYYSPFTYKRVEHPMLAGTRCFKKEALALFYRGGGMVDAARSR